MYIKAATLSGAKIIDRPTMTTTLGQTICQGLMSRFMRDIQRFPSAEDEQADDMR